MTTGFELFDAAKQFVAASKEGSFSFEHDDMGWYVVEHGKETDIENWLAGIAFLGDVNSPDLGLDIRILGDAIVTLDTESKRMVNG